MTAPANLVTYLLDRYCAEPEVRALAGPLDAGPMPEAALVAMGTVATKMADSPQLRAALARAGINRWSCEPVPGPEYLSQAPGWDLAIVLSPFKRDAAEHCDELSPAAQASGVVDTVLRRDGRSLGLNTNTFALEAVADLLLGGRREGTVRVVGTGATARAVRAVQRCRPEMPVTVHGRNPAASAQLAAALGALDGGPGPMGEAALVVHTTTWGETEASETAPLVPDVLEPLGNGSVLFDLNNRVSSLQSGALSRGAVVAGGRAMQSLVHWCRACLLAGSLGQRLPRNPDVTAGPLPVAGPATSM